MGAKRDCFGCGQTCVDCKDLYLRNCNICRNEYCIVDEDGSSPSAVSSTITTAFPAD
jgi:hypothetical protein